MTIDRNIPVEFVVKNTYEVADTRFVEVTIKLMHTEENYNGSFFSKEIVESAIPSLANTPILAYIEDNSNGEIDYSDHRQVLVNDDGQYKIKYIGQAIGVIPETNNARFEKYTTESNVEREYLVVDGLLWTKWDDPIDIIQRDEKHQQSMEIHKNYQGRFEEDNLFHFTYFQFFGACALSNIDVLPAMEEASIELKFSSEDFKKEIQFKMEQFKNFTIQNQPPNTLDVDINTLNNQEGGKEDFMDKKLELLQKYNLTIEQLNFSIDEIELEELESKLKEFTAETNKPKSTFSTTYRQKRNALDNALDPKIERDADGNLTYEEYLWVEDFDDTYVYVEKSIWTANDYERKYGRFTYTFDEVAITATITSEFEEMLLVWLTLEENQKLQEERTNAEVQFEKLKDAFEDYKIKYSTSNEDVEVLKEFQNSTLSTQRKEAEEAIFSQFEQLNDNEQFQELKKNASQFTLEQLEEKSALIVVKSGLNVKFTAKPNKKQTVKLGLTHNHDHEDNNLPYGNLFEKYLPKED